MLRWRRSLALKIVLGASVTYLAVFTFLSRQLFTNDSEDTAKVLAPRRANPGVGAAIGRGGGSADFAAAGDARQPVLGRPDLDSIRFQEAMQRDAERSEQQKQILPDGSDSLNSTQLTERKATMSKMLPLISSGLVVVRWNYEKEVPLVPEGPGITFSHIHVHF